MMKKSFGALPPRSRRRVVVTGMGAVTPLGYSVNETWQRLVAGDVGTRAITDVPYYLPNFIADDRKRLPDVKAKKYEQLINSIPCKVAAPVMIPTHGPGSSAGTSTSDPYAPSSREPRSIKFALAAAHEALDHCGGEAFRAFHPSQRIGISVGMGMAGLQDVADASNALYASDETTSYKLINPFFVPKILGNMAAGMVAIKYGLQGGPISSAVTACATGAHNIGEAFEWVSNGLCDAAICGATESCITPVGIGGFCRMNAMSVKYNEQPTKASRPFDKDRCGFVMGEGAGMLIIEDLESALKRNATIYCELRGYGLSSDGYHVASPHPDGIGAARCITAALTTSGVDAADVGYANAHATGTPMGDEIELNALSRTLRGGDASASPHLAISSIKGAMGHLLGAAGAVEAIATVMALHTNTIPPNTNLEVPVPHDEARVLLPTKALKRDDSPLTAAISTSFGFGGANAAILFTTKPE